MPKSSAKIVQRHPSPLGVGARAIEEDQRALMLSSAMPKSSAKRIQRHPPPPGAKRAPNRWRADYPIPESSNGRALIDPRETARRIGCHPVTLYRWMKSIKGFPIAIRISPNRIAFFEDEVTAYIDSRPRVAVS